MILAIIERIENVNKEEPFNYRYYLTKHYKDIFDKLNILLFPIVSDKNLEKVCEICDGLIVTGSCIDIPPHYYNEEPIPEKNYDIDEFKLDKAAIELFSSANKPILGICRGIQTINVAFNGTLYQDIDQHDQKDITGYHHLVKTKKNTLLEKYLGKKFMTNSFHHQAINKLADGFTISAISDDNVIEAIEKDNIIGIQWHPEKINDKIQQGIIKLFDDLLEEKR